MQPLSMTKTDNEKYVKRGADIFIEYNLKREGEISHANKGWRPVPVLGDADHAGRRPRGRDGDQVQAAGGDHREDDQEPERSPSAISASGRGSLA